MRTMDIIYKSADNLMDVTMVEPKDSISDEIIQYMNITEMSEALSFSSRQLK